MKKKIIRSQCGFTLIEIMIAITVFAIGVLGISKMQIASIFGNKSAIEFTEAATWNSSKIENMLLLAYNDVELNSGATGQIIQGIYTINWTVTQGDPVPNVKRINVVAGWKDKGIQRTFTSDYYKAVTY